MVLQIGLLGPANAGKDTVADMIVEFFGGVVRKHAFADALYAEVAEAFEVSEDYLRDRKWKEKPSLRLSPRFCLDDAFVQVCREVGVSVMSALSPRRVLELWGMEYRRAQDADYWVRRLVDKGGDVVISDVRFSNELQIVAVPLIVRRPGHEILRDHRSDTLWRRVEGVPEVWNTGSLDQLRKSVIDLLSAIPEEKTCTESHAAV